MSFVRTLATLAAGFAAAKGAEHFKKMGGMAGLQDMMAQNPAMSGMQDQMASMMQNSPFAGGMDQIQSMMEQFGLPKGMMGGDGAAGLGGLMAALGGAAATGAEQASGMMDALTGTTAATDAQEENARLMIRAMIQSAKADGEIDEGERARILEHLGDLDPEEIAFVEAELAAPVDPHRLAMETGDAMKAQVYAMSLMAVKVDTVSELDYLNTLADALGLSAETRARVQRSMGLG